MIRPLQAGDLCLIVGDESGGKLIGKCCTLIEFEPETAEFFEGWRVNLDGDCEWQFDTDYLMRIDGNPDEVGLKQQEPETVESGL